MSDAERSRIAVRVDERIRLLTTVLMLTHFPEEEQAYLAHKQHRLAELTRQGGGGVDQIEPSSLRVPVFERRGHDIDVGMLAQIPFGHFGEPFTEFDAYDSKATLRPAVL